MKEEGVIIFDGDNYEEFEMNLTDHLKSKRLYKSIRTPRPVRDKNAKDGIDPKELEKWDEIDDSAQGKIGERISAKFRNLINADTAKGMLDQLKAIDEGSKTTLMITQRRLFQSIQCSESEDIREYLNALA